MPHARAADPSVAELQKEIEARDALIRNLVKRVENLERQVGGGSAAAATKRVQVAAQPRSATPQSVAVTTHPAASEPAAPAPAIPPAQPATTAQVAQQGAQGTPQPEKPTNPASGSKLAPGQFEVSEEAAERALERTLVATGALLVPYGSVDVEPAFGYTRREGFQQVLFDTARNEFSPALAVRVGLPWEMQFELGMPYYVVEQQVRNAFVTPPQQISDHWGNGFGDLTVGLAKTILHEKGWIPDLIGRINYNIPTGVAADNDVRLPSHQNKLTFSLTATKRQDPLVFVGSAAYTKGFVENGITPGDQLSFVTGAYLATSPETSLRAVLTQSFLQDIQLNH
ncbi:MAG: hypothetical protein JO110_12950, partial [Acetobacteraceae bacterium]|nr:hypothetical protein [Acetobacteraceae bacterium]